MFAPALEYILGSLKETVPCILKEAAASLYSGTTALVICYGLMTLNNLSKVLKALFMIGSPLF
jgi:hypothetical protein